MPLLTVTGEDGHVEQYTVDLNLRVVRHCTYTSTRLLREFVVPLDVESPGWSLSGQFIKVSRTYLLASFINQSISQSYRNITACAIATSCCISDVPSQWEAH